MKRIKITERQIDDFRGKLSRIIRNAKLIDAERDEEVQVFTNQRLSVIIITAQEIDEQLKLLR